MKHVPQNTCPLHATLSGNSGALLQDSVLCPDCAGPDEEPTCCALALIRFLSTRCKDPMAFLADCRIAFSNDTHVDPK